MTARKTATTRPSRSRAQVKEDFEELAVETKGAIAHDAKTTAMQAARRAQLAEKFEKVTVGDILTEATDLRLRTNRALDEITEQLSSKTEQLKDLNEAIAIAREEFQTIHKLDLAATALDVLVQEHQEKKVILEKEIEGLRASWVDERKRHDEEEARRQKDLVVSRQREVAEYEYGQKQLRKTQEDAFKQTMDATKLGEKLRSEAFERDLKMRQDLLVSQEKEIFDMRETAAAFDTKVDAEVKRSVAIATSALKKDLTQEFAIEKKDFETKIKILEADKANSDKVLLGQEKLISDLQGKIEKLQAQVVETASKAIDGSARQEAFQQFVTTTREQNNGQTPKRS